MASVVNSLSMEWQNNDNRNLTEKRISTIIFLKFFHSYMKEIVVVTGLTGVLLKKHSMG